MIIRLRSCSKVCKMVHNLCVDKLFVTPKSEAKWAVVFNDMDLNWCEIYSIPLLSSHLTKLRYFQYKILHKIIGTNDFYLRLDMLTQIFVHFVTEHPKTSNICSGRVELLLNFGMRSKLLFSRKESHSL